jgi:hypothetical protein
MHTKMVLKWLDDGSLWVASFVPYLNSLSLRYWQSNVSNIEASKLLPCKIFVKTIIKIVKKLWLLLLFWTWLANTTLYMSHYIRWLLFPSSSFSLCRAWTMSNLSRWYIFRYSTCIFKLLITTHNSYVCVVIMMHYGMIKMLNWFVILIYLVSQRLIIFTFILL